MKEQLLENRRIEFTGKVELPKATQPKKALINNKSEHEYEYEDELDYEDLSDKNIIRNMQNLNKIDYSQ